MCLDHLLKPYSFAENTVKIGAKVLWLQLGIRSKEAQELVRSLKILSI